ncbi:TPA: ThiF family adenylyltransferase [Legionella bozemanae]
MDDYIKFGEELPDKSIMSLHIIKAQETYRACSRSNIFTVVELRTQQDDNFTNEIIVVDCVNDFVPTQNKVGIQYTERLALIFSSDGTKIPEVRALRKNFPDTIHQNLIHEGEPKSLCLYAEKWSAVERYWTPQHHLKRVQEWLEKVALDKLHEADQPVENIYFDTGYKLVLPTNFTEEILKQDQSFTLIPVQCPIQTMILRGEFTKKKDENKSLICIVLNLTPQVHGKIKNYPLTLGQVHNQLSDTNNDLIQLIREKVKEHAINFESAKSQVNVYKDHVFLILNIPIKRDVNSDVERVEVRGFLIKKNVVQIAQDFGDVDVHAGKAGLVLNPVLSTAWQSTPIYPIDINKDFDRNEAQKISDIMPDDANFIGAIIGVGALGSALINSWARCGWGIWTMIDDDLLHPHNLARHIAFNSQIGQHKANAVKEIVQCIYNDKTNAFTPICDNFYSNKNDEIKNVVSLASLIVDVSTTIEIPRDLSLLPDRGRAVSAFFTPSGLTAVMLFEDSLNEIKLDVLELQYYRAIISRQWGEDHLNITNEPIRVGGSCSDLSLSLSNEFVQLHAATLARQVRLQHKKPDAKIQIWKLEPETGGIFTDIINPLTPIINKINGWRIVWDSETQAKVRGLRKSRLPQETGGIILGYIDQKINSIYIVDALPAPTDSISDDQGFIRGIEQVKEVVNSASKRTNGLVTYIGEWHSHPPGVSSNPSKLDSELVNDLAFKLYENGQPGIILIVGEVAESWVIKDLNNESN